MWGRVRYGVRAADEDYGSAQADYGMRGSRSPRSSQRAGSSPPKRACSAEIARDSIGASERTAELARVRSRVGSGDDRDVALADASLQAYRDTIRQLEYSREQALRVLEVLPDAIPLRRWMRPPRSQCFRRHRPPGSLRSFSSAGPTCLPLNDALRRHSAASARRRPPNCRASPHCGTELRHAQLLCPREPGKD